MNNTHRKEKTMANQEQYRAVLDDLLKQRAELHYKVGEIEAAVSALRKLMPDTDIPTQTPRQLPLAVQAGKYLGMSVRWGILCLLNEDATQPLSTGELANALQAGGITTNGKNFAGNVSAVLSEMNRVKREVSSTDAGWVITEIGKQAWIHAKALRARQSPTVSEPLSLQ